MLTITLAQLDLTVGDIKNNTDQIITAINRALREPGTPVILFPELSICAYPPEDLLLRPAFHDDIKQSLDKIVNNTGDIHVLLGHPHRENGKIYNACSLIYQKQIVSIYYKQKLPNYGVFDEKRYFEAGEGSCLFEIDGHKAAISICEDIWVPGPVERVAGADIMFNLSASPYDKNKPVRREEMVAQRARDTNMAIICANLVGGQDEIVFDGSSMVIDKRGRLLFRAPQFEEGLFSFGLEPDKTQPVFSTSYPSEEESIYNALVVGVRDYIRKNHFKGALVGLSGGIDSALTLCIAADALGAENIEALIMPSRYTADMSIEDACTEAETLNVKHEIISIEPVFDSFLTLLQPRFVNLAPDLTEENIQARCRGLILMAVSNKTGKLVLTTGNKSELAVGYATLYGDMAGGFAPLKDVWKTMVYRLVKWRNRDKQIIPERVITRSPSAELRSDQLDQDTLPDYDILDPVLENYIENDMYPEQIIEQGFDAVLVYSLIGMVDKNEYKRRQAAPGVKITKRAFGRDRRYPITSAYVEKK